MYKAIKPFLTLVLNLIFTIIQILFFVLIIIKIFFTKLSENRESLLLIATADLKQKLFWLKKTIFELSAFSRGIISKSKVQLSYVLFQMILEKINSKKIT